MARKTLDKALENMIKDEQNKAIDEISQHIKESISDSDIDIDEVLSNFKEIYFVNKNDQMSSEEKGKKKSTNKNTGKQKKPTSYNNFKRIRTAEISKENGDKISGKERIDMVNQEWKTKTPAEKEKYIFKSEDENENNNDNDETSSEE